MFGLSETHLYASCVNWAFVNIRIFADNYFGEGGHALQQHPDRVLPAKYVNGYTADEATPDLYEKVKREAGYQGETGQIPKPIDDD